MTNILRQLDKLARQIEYAKTEKSEAQGARKSILESMKKEYNVEDLAGAESELSSISEKMRRVAEQIETKFTDLQENYSWEE